MKTTLDLPDDLMRAVKVRAASEGRKMKDIIAEFLRDGLAQTELNNGAKHAPHRIQLPLIRPAGGEPFDLSAERVHELEIEAETERHEASL